MTNLDEAPPLIKTRDRISERPPRGGLFICMLQCGGGEVIVSESVAKDAATGAALADRTLLEASATLRGVSAPVRFIRVSPQGDAARGRAMKSLPA